jgi:ParB-like chromosome segregation protein Spo0J
MGFMFTELNGLTSRGRFGLYESPTHRLGALYSDDKLNNVVAGMRTGVVLPPMVLQASTTPGYRYQVVDGIHRYYGSIKLGHGQLPAVIQ